MEKRSLIFELATLVTFLILIAIVVHFNWFEGKDYIIVNPSDFDFPISPLNDFYRALYSWQSKDLGTYFYGFAEAPLRLGIVALYSLCGFNISIAQQIFFVLVLYTMFLSGYLMLRTLLSYLTNIRRATNHYKISFILPSTIAGNFYMFHMTTLLKYNSGYIFSLIVHAMYPLIFLCSLKYILCKKGKYAVLLILFSLMTVSSHPAYILLIFFVPILAFPVAVVLKRENIKTCVSRTPLCALFLITFTSTYWLPIVITLIYDKAGFVIRQLKDINGILSSAKAVDNFADLFRYLGCPPFRWTYKGDPYYPYNNVYYTPLFVFLGFFTAIVSFSGLLLRKMCAKLYKLTLLFALYVVPVSYTHLTLPTN